MYIIINRNWLKIILSKTVMAETNGDTRQEGRFNNTYIIILLPMLIQFSESYWPVIINEIIA